MTYIPTFGNQNDIELLKQGEIKQEKLCEECGKTFYGRSSWDYCPSCWFGG